MFSIVTKYMVDLKKLKRMIWVLPEHISDFI